ncbi:MAG: LytR C-terminal domain-containing protein [Ilumatobacteraceae bacterium]
MSRDDMGRTSRSVPPAAPIGSSVAVVVTVLALVLGFLILRQVNSDPAAIGPGGDGADSTTTVAGFVPSSTAALPSTTEPMVYSGASVVVANCSSLNGVAKELSLALGGLGWTMVTPVNGSVKLATSKVLYNADDPAALPVAKSVAKTLGGIQVEPAPVPLPAGEGTWPEGAAVLVMLGDDYAGRTIAEIQARPSALPVAVETTTTSTTLLP